MIKIVILAFVILLLSWAGGMVKKNTVYCWDCAVWY